MDNERTDTVTGQRTKSKDNMPIDIVQGNSKTVKPLKCCPVH